MARFYRNMGFYYLSSYNTDMAAACYTYSNIYYHTDNAESELERSEKKSCEDASDDRVIRNIRNVIREKEELKEQRKSGSFMYGVSAFLVVVIIVIGINLMNNYEKMRRLNQSVDNLMNQLEGNERGGQDGDDNGVHDSGIGNPKKASAEKGKKYAEAVVAKYALLFEELPALRLQHLQR